MRDKTTKVTVKHTVELIKPEIGMTSCVGIINPTFPLSFGNYFDFEGEAGSGPDDDVITYMQSCFRCLNMWAENLEHIVKEKEIEKLKVDMFTTSYDDDNPNVSRLAVVIDDRVPEDYITRWCVTGRGWACRAELEFVHKFYNKEIGNELCGCEAPAISPSISIRGKMGSDEPKTYRCWHCKREWED